MLLGLGTTLTPLIAAVITAVVSVDRLAEDYREAVLRAEVATRHGRAIVEELTEMQRAFGQFRVLGAEAFYKAYLDRRAAFREAVTELERLELNRSLAGDLARLLSGEEALFAKTSLGPALGDEDLTPEWNALTGLARGVLEVTGALIQTEAANGVASAGRLQRTLLTQAALAIPASLVLAGLFVVSMTRPIRSLGAAIRRLGSRDLSHEINVKGPRDIEELGRQLDWLRERISSLEEQKVRFIQQISHELKTPLTTLREGSELLAESLAETRPEDAEISRLMKANSLHLQRLIEDLLRFGSAQGPMMNGAIEDDVALDRVIESVVGVQAVSINAKKLNVDTKLAPVRVVGDPGRLGIVVDNLLTNAIKYASRKGKIRIELSASAGRAMVDVMDDGPGVTVDEESSIFEPFVQGSAVCESSVRGTGLGLAIAKEYVEYHDGRIDVIRPGHSGGHFRVTLPVSGPRRPARRSR